MATGLPLWGGKVAVVTGASAGIGAATAALLVDAGFKVVGVARRVDKVQRLAETLRNKSGKLYALKADVSQEEDIISAFEWIKTNVGPIHVLVNNAGVARNTTLIDGDIAEWKRVLDTNLLAVAICSREAIKSMQENDIAGHIVNINSVAGHWVVKIPRLNVYSASKFGVTALSETFRQELNERRSKIKISSISPGTVKTDIVPANNLEGLRAMLNAADNADELLTSEDVARSVMCVLNTPPHVLIKELIVQPVAEIF